MLLALASCYMPTDTLPPTMEEDPIFGVNILQQGGFDPTVQSSQNFVTYRPTDGMGAPTTIGDADLATFGGGGVNGPASADHFEIGDHTFGPEQPPNLATPISYVEVFMAVFRKANGEGGQTYINSYGNLKIRLTNNSGDPWEIGRYTPVGAPTTITARSGSGDNLTYQLVRSGALTQRPADADPTQFDPAVNFQNWAWEDIPNLHVSLAWDYPALGASEESSIWFREVWVDVYGPVGMLGRAIEIKTDAGFPRSGAAGVGPKEISGSGGNIEISLPIKPL